MIMKKRWWVFIVGGGGIIVCGIVIFRMVFLDDTPPLLKHLGVDLRELRYQRDFVSYYGPILPFGAALHDVQGTSQLSPTYEYYTNSDATIYSPIDGRVTRVVFQPEDQDYYLWIRPRKHSAWVVEMDHVQEVVVKVGQQVTAGDILGKAGTWYPQENIGRTELMITQSRWNGKSYYYCPFLFVAESQKEQIRRSLEAVFQKWQKHTGRTIGNMILPGCLYRELKDSPGGNLEVVL